ncbi:MAG: hypothetical protein A2Z14_08375 [Chloroflexi bacterium RBG_16_48_8]|nr:MAG: hypothetical protein A2Z14_08375 [Chloroflexi bacterium RBG_16_48_8]
MCTLRQTQFARDPWPIIGMTLRGGMFAFVSGTEIGRSGFNTRPTRIAVSLDKMEWDKFCIL